MAAGRLTKAQRDELAANLKERVTAPRERRAARPAGRDSHRHGGLGGPGFGSAGSSEPAPQTA